MSDRSGVSLRSFKLRFDEPYAWIVPATDERGEPFVERGVTLRSADAIEAQTLAAPLNELLNRYEPGVQLRTISIDLTLPRLLATLTADHDAGTARPRVLRLDGGPLLGEVIDATALLREFLIIRVREALHIRGATSPLLPVEDEG